MEDSGNWKWPAAWKSQFEPDRIEGLATKYNHFCGLHIKYYFQKPTNLKRGRF